jgi:hypothetical protein
LKLFCRSMTPAALVGMIIIAMMAASILTAAVRK